MLNLTPYFPIESPTLIFFVVLLIILLAPIIMGKLRIPHIIGMVLAGVLVGQYGFNILQRDGSFELFGKVGLYYIMFLAGLEMDMEGIKKNSRQFLVFGLLTFGVPFGLTYITAPSLLGYSPLASLLLSCIMASNTLVAYPIVGRYGLQRHAGASLSVGSTMIALFLSLVILAALVAGFEGGSGWRFWLVFLLKFSVYCAAMGFFLPRLTRWFLRRYSDQVMQYTFVLSMLFLSAALSEAVGLEGIFGAFLSGLIMNRYIPRLSPLMNRIEFIGNAIFIPYFLIGVGMLINMSVLFSGGGIVWVVLYMVFIGTFGKALAAYLSSVLLRLPLSWGHMMFGLTSAHAAGAIAMVMVGNHIEVSPGVWLVGDDMLNGVVIMILFTCVISTLQTERASKQIILKDERAAGLASERRRGDDDEKILIPVKYPDIATRLFSLATLVRNPKLGRGVVCLNVVYDDNSRLANQDKGRQLLEQLARQASSAGVPIESQVRIAANIANGIKHAFKEFQTSEIIMGMHIHKDVSTKFWGTFAQSLYNGLSRQIMLVRLNQPLNTLRRIQVAVPSRAEFEPGFYRWLERLSRLAANLECRIQFHGRNESLRLIGEYIRNRHPQVRAEYTFMAHWNELPRLASSINEDHIFVVITARKGTVSYKSALERLPDELEQHFSGKNLMIIFPDQYGNGMDTLTFAEHQHQEEESAYQALRKWLERRK